jgi:hypothetical protein
MSKLLDSFLSSSAPATTTGSHSNTSALKPNGLLDSHLLFGKVALYHQIYLTLFLSLIVLGVIVNLIVILTHKFAYNKKLNGSQTTTIVSTNLNKYLRKMCQSSEDELMLKNTLLNQRRTIFHMSHHNYKNLQKKMSELNTTSQTGACKENPIQERRVSISTAPPLIKSPSSKHPVLSQPHHDSQQNQQHQQQSDPRQSKLKSIERNDSLRTTNSANGLQKKPTLKQTRSSTMNSKELVDFNNNNNNSSNVDLNSKKSNKSFYLNSTNQTNANSLSTTLNSVYLNQLLQLNNHQANSAAHLAAHASTHPFAHSTTTTTYTNTLSHIKRTLSSYYIICLSLCDLFICLVNMSLHLMFESHYFQEIVWRLMEWSEAEPDGYTTTTSTTITSSTRESWSFWTRNTWTVNTRNNMTCKLVLFFIQIPVVFEIEILLTIAINRYSSVFRPIKLYFVDRNKLKLTVIAQLLFSSFLSLPNLLFYVASSSRPSLRSSSSFASIAEEESYTNHSNTRYSFNSFCVVDHQYSRFYMYYQVVLFALFLLNLFIITVCYLKIYKRIYKASQTQRRESLTASMINQTSLGPSSNSKQEHVNRESQHLANLSQNPNNLMSTSFGSLSNLSIKSVLDGQQQQNQPVTTNSNPHESKRPSFFCLGRRPNANNNSFRSKSSGSQSNSTNSRQNSTKQKTDQVPAQVSVNQEEIELDDGGALAKKLSPKNNLSTRQKSLDESKLYLNCQNANGLLLSNRLMSQAVARNNKPKLRKQYSTQLDLDDSITNLVSNNANNNSNNNNNNNLSTLTNPQDLSILSSSNASFSLKSTNASILFNNATPTPTLSSATTAATTTLGSNSAQVNTQSSTTNSKNALTSAKRQSCYRSFSASQKSADLFISNATNESNAGNSTNGTLNRNNSLFINGTLIINKLRRLSEMQHSSSLASQQRNTHPTPTENGSILTNLLDLHSTSNTNGVYIRRHTSKRLRHGKTARLLGIATLALALTWTPYWFYLFYSLTSNVKSSQSDHMPHAFLTQAFNGTRTARANHTKIDSQPTTVINYLLSKLLKNSFYLNYVLNPIFYSFVDHRFRRNVKSMFEKFFKALFDYVCLCKCLRSLKRQHANTNSVNKRKKSFEQFEHDNEKVQQSTSLMRKLVSECFCCASDEASKSKKPINECENGQRNEEHVDGEEREERQAFILNNEINEQANK